MPLHWRRPLSHPVYVDVAVRRWQAFAGQAAVLEGTGATFEAIGADRAAGEGGAGA